MDRIVLFGDSITERSGDGSIGFALHGALCNDYIRRLDVLNRGYSGYQTSQALQLLPKIIPPPESGRIRLITIYFGANDSVIPDRLQHVPLETFKSNLRAIVTHPAIRAHDANIVLITTPPPDERVLAQSPDLGGSRTAVNTARYADTVIEVGRDLGVHVLDLWSAMMAHAGWNRCSDAPLPGSLTAEPNSKLMECLSDGLHFTPFAYKMLYDELTALIKQYMPQLLPDALPQYMPDWKSLYL